MKLDNPYEAILNCMNEAVYLVDWEMNILYSNPSAEVLTGFSIAEAEGAKCHDIFCETSFRCKDICPPKVAMREKKPILHREAETKTKSGAVRNTEISFSPFYKGSECVGSVIVIKDITEIKKAEAEKENLINELQKALDNIRQLSGLLPICASCKKIRDDKGYWNNIEAYISEHSEALFTHAICPECGKGLYPKYYDEVWGKEDKKKE